MRTYLYASGAKIDMLFGQIPAKLLRCLAVEAKLDLKVLSVQLQSPRDEISEYDRLQVVESYLEREYEVSWITEPASWFRGDLPLRIAGYGRPSGPVFMTGQEGDTVVALIGSAHHLVGQRVGPESIPPSHAALPSLFRLLRETPEDWPLGEPRLALRDCGRARRNEPLRQVLEFSRLLKEPAVYCDFLARRLMHGTLTTESGRELQIVVGTPLYVAQSDEAEGR